MTPKPARAVRRGITRVLEDVRYERYGQISKGWTPEHDDMHTPESLRDVAEGRLGGIAVWNLLSPEVRRKRLIQCIAVLVASVESIDRKAADR